jgi:hypothetical protein
MALAYGKGISKEIKRGVISTYKTRIYFLNNNLYKVIKADRSSNICHLYTLETEEVKKFLYSDFKKFRKSAYRIGKASKFLNRHPDRIRRAIWTGQVTKPLLVKTGSSGSYWFTEENIHELREFFANVHRGRPRRDGIVVSHNVPTKDELDALLGNKEMLYIKNKNGDFIPVWRAEEF